MNKVICSLALVMLTWNGHAQDYEGIPSPSVALGFDVFSEELKPDKVLSGKLDRHTIECVGTAADPCFVDATNASFTSLKLKGKYIVLQGGKLSAPQARGPFVELCSYCVARDLHLVGPKTDNSHSSAVWMVENSVWLRGKIHGFGDNRTDAREQDFHGFKVMADNVWILEAEIFDMSGDSVQVGDASRGSANNVYIGGGRFYNNRENGVDIKDSRNVVVSGVTMYGFRPTESSPGEAIIIHDDAYDAKIINNDIYDSTMGIVSSGHEGHVITKNKIKAKDVGIELRNTRNLTVLENEIDAPQRYHIQHGLSFKKRDFR